MQLCINFYQPKGRILEYSKRKLELYFKKVEFKESMQNFFRLCLYVSVLH